MPKAKADKQSDEIVDEKEMIKPQIKGRVRNRPLKVRARMSLENLMKLIAEFEKTMKVASVKKFKPFSSVQEMPIIKEYNPFYSLNKFHLRKQGDQKHGNTKDKPKGDISKERKPHGNTQRLDGEKEEKVPQKSHTNTTIEVQPSIVIEPDMSVNKEPYNGDDPLIQQSSEEPFEEKPQIIAIGPPGKLYEFKVTPENVAKLTTLRDIKLIAYGLKIHKYTSYTKTTMEKLRNLIYDKIGYPSQTGSGDSTIVHKAPEPLYGSQINVMLNQYAKDGFLGTFAYDQIPEVAEYVNDFDRIGFVFNTDVQNEPGSHWEACYIDFTNSKEVDYYNSLGDPIPDDFLVILKKIIDARKGLKYYLKLKENLVRKQANNSNTCGFFAIKFLMDMFNGKSYKEATDFKGIRNEEKDIRGFGKGLIEKFGYI